MKVKAKVRIITKSGEVFFGDSYNIDPRNRQLVYLNYSLYGQYSMQVLDEAAKCANKHGIDISEISRIDEELVEGEE